MSQVVPKPPRVSDRDFRRGIRGRRRHRRRAKRILRRVLIGAAIAVPAIAALGLLAIFPATSAKGHLEAGKTALEKAQSALLDGDLDIASGDFALAEQEFRAAKSDGDSPLLRIPALVPFIGRTPDAVRTIAAVGVRLSSSGREITDAIAELPGGLDALSPVGGRIPIETLTGLSPIIARARQQFELAARQADGIATTMVPREVVEAGDLLRSKLDRALPIVRAADGMLKALPAFAGADAPRHYFLAPQNPTELRGTGGLFSAYAILTIDDGNIEVGEFQDTKKLPNLGGPSWPSPELEEIYGNFNSAGFWRSTNATPDAPTAASFIESLWLETQGTPLDGVIFVDVQTLRYFLEAIGKVEVKGVPFPLSDKNVVQFVSNDAYTLIEQDKARQDFVGVVGQVIFDRFLEKAHGDRALRALVRAAADGHIVVHSADPAVQEALESAGVTGELGPPEGGDYFDVVVNNEAGNKVDYFISREISYDVRLLSGGDACVHATVTFANGAPVGAEPSYVLGPFEGKDLRGLNLQPGDAFQSTSIYCASGCEVTSATRDGGPLIAARYIEQGLPLLASTFRIEPQTSTTIELEMELHDVWSGSDAIGNYTLHLGNQPTILPTTAKVTIHAPEGTSISFAGDPLQVSGDTASWTGELQDLTGFEMRFQRGPVGRLWTYVSDFLSKPVIRL